MLPLASPNGVVGGDPPPPRTTVPFAFWDGTERVHPVRMALPSSRESAKQIAILRVTRELSHGIKTRTVSKEEIDRIAHEVLRAK